MQRKYKDTRETPPLKIIVKLQGEIISQSVEWTLTPFNTTNGSGKTNCGLFLPKELLLKSFTYVSTPQKRGILERLDAGEVVIGDGGFVFALEKRGYVQAGPWTPEANVEHPSAGKEFC